MGLGDTFDFYEYTSDDGTGYGLKLSVDVATAGGFSTTVDPRAIKMWSWGTKNVRHVEGLAGVGQRTRLPIATPGNALYVIGGAFTLHGRAYGVQGAIGEKRKLNSVK